MTSPSTFSAPNGVSIKDEWVVANGCPFYTKTWIPQGDVKASILLVHGFNEHISRYDTFLCNLSSLSSARITGFDQRGFGRTAFSSPPADLLSKEQGVKRSKKGVTSTGEQQRDIEFFVRREAARAEGGKVWLFGHSMGGGLVLSMPGFSSSAQPPFASLLAGVIAGSPLIHQTHPASKITVAAGTFVSNLGSFFAERLIPAPVDTKTLTRDPVEVKKNEDDPMCPQEASMSILGGMLNHGKALLTGKVAEAWPLDLPLLMLHGTADEVTSCAASQKFHSSLPEAHSKNKLVTFPDAYHELYLEIAPVPDEVVREVAAFVGAHGAGGVASKL